MIGFAMTGSFCNMQSAMQVLERLCAAGNEILPIMSENVFTMDTKFGLAQEFIQKAQGLCHKPVIHTIQEAEPIGPSIVLDCLCICPCSGNTLSKMANGICDTPVTMAAKAQLRNERPVVIALASNDALSGCAVSMGKMLQRRNLYFVPMSQDNPTKKPRSLVCHFDRVEDTIEMAKEGKQIQPIFDV